MPNKDYISVNYPKVYGLRMGESVMVAHSQWLHGNFRIKALAIVPLVIQIKKTFSGSLAVFPKWYFKIKSI